MGANAVTSVPVYASGDVLTAANLNITNSGVPVFATTTTRDAAFGGTGEKTLAEGQMCYIEAAPKRFQVYNGTAWLDYDTEYTTFTPTISNYTRGNGNSTGKYLRLGKWVTVFVREVLGTTSAMGTGPVLTLPLTAASLGSIGAVPLQILDSGTAFYGGQVFFDSTTTGNLRALNTAGTYAVEATITATVPMTWTTNDYFQLTLNYELA